MIKLSFNLEDARKVGKATRGMILKKTKLRLDASIMRDWKNKYLRSPGPVFISRANDFKRLRPKAKIHSNNRYVPYGKISTPHGGSYRAFGSPKLKTGEEYEMVNRLAVAHERSESKVKNAKKYYGHLSPSVLVEESNMISTMPHKFDRIKKLLIKGREGDEINNLDKHLGFKFGAGRVNRRMKKFIVDKYNNMDIEFKHKPFMF